MLELKHIYFAYDIGSPYVLKDINLQVHDGDYISEAERCEPRSEILASSRDGEVYEPINRKFVRGSVPKSIYCQGSYGTTGFVDLRRTVSRY